jgi:ATP-dependent DNA helicase RecG
MATLTPIFYTDDERTLFLVTLPCHLEVKFNNQLTKSVTKSVTKSTDSQSLQISIEEVNVYFSDIIDYQLVSKILDNNISSVLDYVRGRLKSSISSQVTKSVTKSLLHFVDLIDFMKEEKSREEILSFLGLGNQTRNAENNIKPLLEIGVLEMTVPDKPKSQNQKYKLSDKGRKLLKN